MIISCQWPLFVSNRLWVEQLEKEEQASIAVILDSRIVHKRYGKQIRQALAKERTIREVNRKQITSTVIDSSKTTKMKNLRKRKGEYMKRSLDSRVDYSLLLPVFFLLVIGVVAIYIAVSHDYPNNILPILGQQVAWIALGLVIGFVVMLFNTEFLWKVTPFLYILGLGLMVLPIVFYNPSLVASTGAKNWVSVNGVTLFQPSEFMKISYILMLARVIVQFTKKHKEWRRTIPLDFLLIFWMMSLPFQS